MNNIIVGVSLLVATFLINGGVSLKVKVKNLKNEYAQICSNNFDMEQKINDKKYLKKKVPVLLSVAYGLVMNQMRILENESGTDMSIQLETAKELDDVSSEYETTSYTGIKGLRIKIIVDKFTKGTDMGFVLDDIYQLELKTDFLAKEISKDSNNLTVRGEIYGL